MRYTMHLAEALLGPMQVAEALAARHEASMIVAPAVALCQATLAQCQVLVSEPPDDSSEAWSEWLASTAEGVTKLRQLQEMQEQLCRAMAALQLALTAVNASTLPARFAASPFRYLPEAFDAAQRALLELEMSRAKGVLLCAGELWRRGVNTSAKGNARSVDTMKKLWPTEVWLVEGQSVAEVEQSSKSENVEQDGDSVSEGGDDGDDDDDDGDENDAGGEDDGARVGVDPSSAASALQQKLFVRFTRIRSPHDGDDDGDGSAVAVQLDDSVCVRRLLSEELAADLHQRHGRAFVEVVGTGALCYELRPSARRAAQTGQPTSHVLVFRFVRDGLSAEACEALLFMALCTLHVSDESVTTRRPLASIFAEDEPRALCRFMKAMQANVGTLLDAPGNSTAAGRKGERGLGGEGRDSTVERDSSLAEGLSTPMRSLNISQALTSPSSQLRANC